MQVRHISKNTLSYTESILDCLGKAGSTALNSGEKCRFHVRNTFKEETLLSQDKPPLTSLRKQ